ncbi:MAG TPA: hypothetical protein VK451_04015, partial [Methyloceanibacter sp.]|nr:hypothetical protein [Methyloceanibacter sp.]
GDVVRRLYARYLPADAHPGLTADAVDIVAEGDVDPGEQCGNNSLPRRPLSIAGSDRRHTRNVVGPAQLLANDYSSFLSAA